MIKDEMMRRWGLRPRRAWRFAHGWSQSALAARYNARYAEPDRAPMSDGRIAAYEKWPQDQRERPSLQVLVRLAELFDTTVDQVIDGEDLAHMPETDQRALRDIRNTAPAPSSTAAPIPPDSAYRGWREADIPSDPGSQHRVVAMAAHEGSEHAEQAERRDIGDATLAQMRADVERLSHDYMTGEPFPVFQEMTRLRHRIWAALDRRLWPRDQTELYFLLGVLHVLMAAAAHGLGNRQAAEELIRAGWAYATGIDHRPLMAHLRLELANIVFWTRPRNSRDLARSGLSYLSEGQTAAQLHLRHGRAAARLGDADTARQAITAAHQAASQPHHDDVLDIGGEFGLSTATRHFLAGSIMLELPNAHHEAIHELSQAADLYTTGPARGEDHYDGYIACNGVALATALLRNGHLDAATDTLQPILNLPPNRRIQALLQRLRYQVRPELADPRYAGTQATAELDGRIEEFSQETIVQDLGELSAGRG
ncbi:helix-turn-helix transcriptional regulator [Actinomadura macra]|uniref:helix-turn-helix transcriptional regulator n=1 Tax=Actinomadura macra TaxID=46164 RepID=UPI0012F9FCA9|nr:helix-turn-helix domain-containing protein [Actinomadura macra]